MTLIQILDLLKEYYPMFYYGTFLLSCIGGFFTVVLILELISEKIVNIINNK
jgi:hypothetical protein